MEYCCNGLKNLISSAGERGHSALVWISSDKKIRLLLQSRGISYIDLEKLRPMDIDVKVNLSSEIGILYCPFCGNSVDAMIEKNQNHFRELAIAHAKYLKGMARLRGG